MFSMPIHLITQLFYLESESVSVCTSWLTEPPAREEAVRPAEPSPCLSNRHDAILNGAWVAKHPERSWRGR